MTISPTLIKQINKQYNEGRSYESLAEEYGVSRSTIQNWCRDLYTLKPYKGYTRDFKESLVHLHEEEGRTYDSLVDEFGVSRSSIINWCRSHRLHHERK